VQSHWDLGPIAMDPLPGGMNSTTWTVTTSGGDLGRRWVAKAVRADQRDGFLRGLGSAIRVDAAGIPTGPPEPRRDGHLSADVADGVMALLRWVDGHPLSGGSEHEQTLIGTTLGRAHRALRGAREVERADAAGFPQWVDVDAPHLGVEHWIRPAVRTALAQYTARVATVATFGPLHGDPAPEAFLWAPAERRCGLIDWSSAVHGPLLYDLATAVMFVGGPTRAGALLEAYAHTAALPAEEITTGLGLLLRVRWAVQADYFARRLAADDCTGISEPAQNLAGLHDAREYFGSGG
jgi:Ser/Thr protein kinase RdoA (MazF antagonist)